jgi:signal transduction histidine kinase/CheY-like chemotaxis protein/AraC-like DNA-binding protein
MRGVGMGERLLGDAFLYQGKNEEAIPHYIRSDSAFESAAEMEERFIVLSNLGFAYTNLGRFGDAIEIFGKKVDLARAVGDKNVEGSGLRSIGNSLMRQGEYEEAIPYLRKSLTLETKNNPAAMAYQEMGVAFDALGQPDSALHFLHLALQSAEKYEQPMQAAESRRMLGAHFIKTGELAKAESHLSEALAYYDSRKSYFGAAGLFRSLSDLELARSDYEKAADWALKGLEAAKSGSERRIRAPFLYANLYKAYSALGQYEKALEYALAWKEASDTLAAQDNARKIAEVETRFRTQEQNALIQSQQRQIERQRGMLLIGLLALLLAASLAIMGRNQARAKKRKAEYELALREAETQRMRELDKVKSAFFANISHEFRTPLTLLIGPLKEMEAGRFQGAASKYYGIMRRNAERLLQLVDQLLDLSRLENGKLTLQPSPGDLNASLRAMAGSFESLAERRQIHFDVFIPSAPAWAIFDRDKLEKIVSNLLSNAFKFTPEEGTVKLEVSYPEENGNKRVRVSVEDTGIGIPPGQLSYIFDRFYRVENNADDPGGSGIGLALVRELTQLLGGEIKVHSKEGQGTSFTVELPFEPAPPQAAAQEKVVEALTAVEIPAPETESGPKSGVVLVVEDNADLRAYIGSRLQDQYRVVQAENGRAALELARKDIPDLILTDLMMPEMDGLEFTRQLKGDARTSHIPVIMLTARAEREDRIGGLQTGAEAYLTKPFDPEELQALVARLVEQRRLLQEKYSKQLVLGAPPPPSPSVDDLFLNQVLKAIEENLDDDLFGVEQLARQVNMSRSNLFRKLEALIGKSPTHLIRELRLARARQLLEQGAGNISEVAMQVGFNTPAYFVKCFADQYGVTPGEVRKGR